MMLNDERSGDRIALILESDLQYNNKGLHVEVRVKDKSESKVHVVKLNSTLHRLLDNNDLDCKLFLAYLHALTSHCLPDPATLHTGTEQAFTILRSKAVESFSQLSQANVNMLGKIAQLSPGRLFYPGGKRVMQSVKWDQGLPVLSQHDDLLTVVAGLFRQSEASKIFHPEIELQITRRKDIKDHLQARASMRASVFHVSGFGAENHNKSHDLIYNSRDQEKNRFAIMALLCTISFSKNAQMDQLQLLAMCAKSRQLALVQAPSAASFSPDRGRLVSGSMLETILNRYLLTSHETPEWNIARQENEKRKDYDRRRESAWKQSKNEMVRRVVNSLKSQWPCATPVNPQVTDVSKYILIDNAMPLIKDEFNARYHNSLLYDYLVQLLQALERLPISKLGLPASLQPIPTAEVSNSSCISEADLFLVPAPPLPCKPVTLLASDDQCTRSTDTAKEPRLKALIEKMTLRRTTGKKMTNPSWQQLSTHLEGCKRHVEGLYQTILGALTSSTKAKAAYDVSHSPRVSPVLLLKQLSYDRWPRLSHDWQKSIVKYGLAITALQRAARLVKLAGSGRSEDVASELMNVGHVNWDPFQFPETLLIEAESRIMVRQVQEQIAREMRRPSSGRNAVMQLNMGEGKSSVIVPIVAAHLADGSQLVRVIVAKSQSKQMAQILISKLGGLVNRRVYYLPMLWHSSQVARTWTPSRLHLHNACHKATLISGRQDVAQSAIASQSFLDSHSRDIVDESDENFSPRFELIYTMGTQRLIEASPGRWQLIEQVLEFVRRTIPAVAEHLPPSTIEMVPGVSGAFPRTRVLQEDAGNYFVKILAAKICSDEINLVKKSAVRWTETNRPQLLLLRGLLADGVLLFLLSQKRWRVNYGLADRTPATKVAVPFRAKDTPALYSEFSHPDVVIALTLLSYYYKGLDNAELFAAFAHLTNSDQAEITYQEWVGD
ncbi:Uu.00g019610.m01.CDS01 [Anthostomella pinea]|uniref:ubiquitinyl hydrolase 1 n=1 Tax=Anthostomella pinea TaxID=933095 RepID=A0AAI8VZB6_9PEZI|nr:Uu.00g019610.m01.CDS01 [Anthostomella pinea]